MPQTHIIAILTPAKGKSQRLKELLAGICKDVHEKEDYTLRYIATERIDGENSEDPEMIMIETYKDKDATDKHMSTQHFKDVFAKFEEEGIFAKEPFLAKTQSKSGFDLDHQLI